VSQTLRQVCVTNADYVDTSLQKNKRYISRLHSQTLHLIILTELTTYIRCIGGFLDGIVEWYHIDIWRSVYLRKQTSRFHFASAPPIGCLGCAKWSRYRRTPGRLWSLSTDLYSPLSRYQSTVAWHAATCSLGTNKETSESEMCGTCISCSSEIPNTD